VRAAVAHILFKIIGVIIWFGFIDQLALLVRSISPAAPELEGLARLAAEAPRQIANAHTIFNLANTFIFIWLIAPFATLLQWLIPQRKLAEPELAQPKYLDDKLIETPALALDRVRLELDRLGHYTLRMVRNALQPVFYGSHEELAALAKMDDDVDALHGAIVTYLGQISRKNLLRSESDQLADYMAIANHLENIGDMVETNLVEVGNERLKHHLHVSESTRKFLAALHEKVAWAVERALAAQAAGDSAIAEEVMAAKLEINRLATQAESHLAHRLIAEEPNRLASFRLESEMIEYLKRVYYFAKRIAKITTDTDLVYKQVDIDYLSKEAAI
jgi:phosphate:Na+ symporter